jgi:hypothetical protein
MDAGLNHMKKLMSQDVNKKPRFSIHPRCSFTKEALLFGFHYKIMNDNRIANKPLDNEYMHTMDADRYAICNAMPIEEERNSQFSGGPIKARGMIHRKR